LLDQRLTSPPAVRGGETFPPFCPTLAQRTRGRRSRRPRGDPVRS